MSILISSIPISPTLLIICRCRIRPRILCITSLIIEEKYYKFNGWKCFPRGKSKKTEFSRENQKERR
jgi:hypothetical protein